MARGWQNLSDVGDCNGILTSLEREAEALSELELRWARLSGDRDRGHAQLDALTAAIDDRIDASVLIWKRLASGPCRERRTTDVRSLERQLRRLGVLRAEVIALYVAWPAAPRRC